ncbi:MAG: hypothetical protein C0404_14415 [Verrucomicrobia bacterium]|nr:hypothetical protein [Verrucomicrobiota bacterium]
MNKKDSIWKMHVGFGLVCVCMVGLVARVAYLHLGPHDNFRNAVRKNQKVEKTIVALRGSILDCKGDKNVLAMNVRAKDVCVDPDAIVKSNKVAEVTTTLAQSLKLEQHDVFKNVNQPGKRFACVQKGVQDDLAEAIRKKKLMGVFLQDATVRNYPQGSFLCHVMGFVNNEGVGSAGVEQYCNRSLTGSAGRVETKVNALRQELYLERRRYVAPNEGHDVVLTIDQNMQYMVEKELDEAMAQHRAKAAWCIIQRVRTGEILAMGSRPGYDLNRFYDAGDDELLNRTIGNNYEPGSTFKAITFSAAFNEGVVKQEQMFDCEDGAWMFAGRILHDYHRYGMLTVADGLKKSSNIMTVKIANILGEKRVYTYMKAFGIGEKTGIDLPGEERGLLSNPSKWSKLSIGRIPIGQGVSVTSLQLLGVYAAIANDGYLMKPYVISEIRDKEGKVTYKGQPEVMARPISAETSALMRRLLARVTEEGGTGTKARIEGYEVAGKTGTAEKAVNGVYPPGVVVASFVGFFPAESPEVAMVFVVDEPQALHTGGVVAAPSFGKIGAQVVRYLDIQPSEYALASVKK